MYISVVTSAGHMSPGWSQPWHETQFEFASTPHAQDNDIPPLNGVLRSLPGPVAPLMPNTRSTYPPLSAICLLPTYL